MLIPLSSCLMAEGQGGQGESGAMESSLAAPHLGTQRSRGTGWRSSGALGSGIDSG